MGGTIVGAGINCGTSGSLCEAIKPAAVSMALQAAPDAGYTFAGWTGDCSGTGASLTILVNGLKTCGGKFAAAGSATPTSASTSTSTAADSTLIKGAPYSLVLSLPTGGTIRTAGTVCGTAGTDCRVTFTAPMWLGLLATPDPGHVFAGWTGHCSGTSVRYDLALNGPRSCGAAFSRASSGATPVITWTTPAAIVEGTALSTAQLNARTGVAGTFAYSPAAGTVLAVGTRTLSTTFTPADTSRYTVAKATRSLVVTAAKKTAPVITWTTPAAIVQGTALSVAQLNARTGVAGTFAYSPAAGAVLAAGTRTLSATFTPADTSRYTVATATRSLVVTATTKTTPTITWTTPAAIVEGTALSAAQLNARTGVAGTFAYSPAAGTVLAVGTRTLSTTFTPADAARYAVAKATRSLVVTAAQKTAPVITWTTPAAIVQGTALSATQLNARTGVAGTFAYSPAAGTVLAAGTRTLSATFTPADTSRYTVVTATRSLVVTATTKTTPTITWATPAAIVQGAALSATQLNARTGVAGTFAYSPAAGTVLAAGTHTLSATFTPADATRYNAASTTRSLVVSDTPDTPPPPPPVPGSIAIKLERVYSGPATISFGLPIAPGVAADTSMIRVYVGSTPVDAHIKPLLYDYDRAGNPSGLRAALVQFPASMMSGRTLTIGVKLGDSGPTPPSGTVPFESVSVDSPQTVTVADRTIVQDGSTYRLQTSNERQVTLFTAREPAVIAHFPPGYLAESGVLGPQVGAADVAADPDLAGLRYLSDALTPFVRSAVYAESYPLNPEPTSVINPIDNYEGWLYDRCATFLTASVHAGDPAVLRHAMRACSFYSSKISLEEGFNRGIFTLKPSRDTKYSHARGLFAYYALTGDEGAFAAVHAIADLWNTDPYVIGPYRLGHLRGVDKLWTERLLGTGLEGLFYGFRLTGNKTYLTAFREVVATAYRHITTTDPAELVAINKDPNTPPFPAQGCWIHNAAQHAEGSATEPWCSSWMSELVIDSLIAYQTQTGDARVDEIFLQLARFLRDVGSSYFRGTILDDFFLSPSVAYSALDGSAARRLVPLYGAALRANGTRASAGEYSDFEHCPDATALTAAALRALVRQGTWNQGGPIGPFSNEGESMLALHHEFSSCAQRTIAVRNVTQYHDPAAWTSAKLAAGFSDPAAFISKWGIGYPGFVTSPQRKLSWWFNTSMLQFGLLRDAGIKIPVLQPGAVQPR
jgi:hypothetical protein